MIPDVYRHAVSNKMLQRDLWKHAFRCNLILSISYNFLFVLFLLFYTKYISLVVHAYTRTTKIIIIMKKKDRDKRAEAATTTMTGSSSACCRHGAVFGAIQTLIYLYTYYCFFLPFFISGNTSLVLFFFCLKSLISFKKQDTYWLSSIK